MRASHHRDAVQYLLGVDLLDEPHSQIDGHNSNRNQGIRGSTQEDQRDRQSEEHRVDERQHVVTNNL